jgi:ribose-phosphate pyrophosphokinase
LKRFQIIGTIYSVKNAFHKFVEQNLEVIIVSEAFGVLNTIPVGPLGIIALPGCEELAQKIDGYISKWREERDSEHKSTIAF